VCVRFLVGGSFFWCVGVGWFEIWWGVWSEIIYGVGFGLFGLFVVLRSVLYFGSF